TQSTYSNSPVFKSLSFRFFCCTSPTNFLFSCCNYIKKRMSHSSFSLLSFGFEDSYSQSFPSCFRFTTCINNSIHKISGLNLKQIRPHVLQPVFQAIASSLILSVVIIFQECLSKSTNCYPCL